MATTYDLVDVLAKMDKRGQATTEHIARRCREHGLLPNDGMKRARLWESEQTVMACPQYKKGGHTFGACVLVELDQLGGTSHGLNTVRDGRAYETIYAVEARLQKPRIPAEVIVPPLP